MFQSSTERQALPSLHQRKYPLGTGSASLGCLLGYYKPLTKEAGTDCCSVTWRVIAPIRTQYAHVDDEITDVTKTHAPALP
jgi:hypothetical protein